MPGYLHPKPDPEAIDPVVEEREAIGRIAFTHDGLLMHRYLRRTLEAVFDLEPSSALPTQNGRRSLARDLMRLMQEGIENQSGRSSDIAILTRGSAPVATRAGRGAARRVAPDPDVERALERDTNTAAGDDSV